MSEAITSVRFAGASMRFESVVVGSFFDDPEGTKTYFGGHFATIFMYRQDVRSVHVWTNKERTQTSLVVSDCAGNAFDVVVSDHDDIYEVNRAICEWRMAASERWEAETRARPANRQARPKPKPKAAIVRPSSDDDDDG